MKITIEKIQDTVNNQNPGIADAWISEDDFECPITLAYTDKEIADGSEIENGCITLYHLSNKKNIIEIYENENVYMKESGSNMSAESLIPIGNFSDNKSAYCMINATVTDIAEKEEYICVELNCNGLTFYAIIDKPFDKKIKTGNIISAVWWAELNIEC